MKRSDETEKRIIQAALELFIRDGYHGTSIKDITEKVGLTKGALYTHFRGKGDLLLRIIQEFNTQYIEVMVTIVNRYPGDAIAKLNCAISFSSRFALKNPDLCLFLTFLTTELSADVDFEPALKAVYSTYRKFISHLISEGIRQGLIDKTMDPELGALTFMAIHDGVLHQWALNRDHINGEDYVRTFRSIFIKGLTSSHESLRR